MDRVRQVGGHVVASDAAASSFPCVASEYFAFDELLAPAERALRATVRAFAETYVLPRAARCWEKAEFPHDLLPAIAKLGICGSTVKGFGSPGLSHMANVAVGTRSGRSPAYGLTWGAA